MPNGIDLILADHEVVNTLFTEFSAAPNGPAVGQIVDMLKAHDEAEQAALYPIALAVLGDTDLITRSELAHSAVKRQIDLLSGLEGAPLIAAVDGLRALVQEHVNDEETNLLPALNEAATPDQLEELAARILQAKQRGG